jgi:hypothetical protein
VPAVQVVKGGSCPTQKTRAQRRAIDSNDHTEPLYPLGKRAGDGKTYGPIFPLNIQERFCPKKVGSVNTKCNYMRGFDSSYLDTSDSSAKRDLSTIFSNVFKDNSSTDETHHWEKRTPKTIGFCPLNPVNVAISPDYYASGEQMRNYPNTPVYGPENGNDCKSTYCIPV